MSPSPWRGALPLVLVALSAGLAGFWLFEQLNEATGPKAGPSRPMSTNAALAGQRRPDFTLPDLAGKPRNIAEWDGRVVLVNFWASWCPPCRKEMPGFNEVHARLQGAGFTIVGVAIDDAEAARSFVDEIGVNYPVLHGQLEASQVSAQYGNRMGALPFSVLIDREGKMRLFHAGELRADVLEAEVKKLL